MGDTADTGMAEPTWTELPMWVEADCDGCLRFRLCRCVTDYLTDAAIYFCAECLTPGELERTDPTYVELPPGRRRWRWW